MLEIVASSKPAGPQKQHQWSVDTTDRVVAFWLGFGPDQSTVASKLLTLIESVVIELESYPTARQIISRYSGLELAMHTSLRQSRGSWLQIPVPVRPAGLVNTRHVITVIFGTALEVTLRIERILVPSPVEQEKFEVDVFLPQIVEVLKNARGKKNNKKKKKTIELLAQDEPEEICQVACAFIRPDAAPFGPSDPWPVDFMSFISEDGDELLEVLSPDFKANTPVETLALSQLTLVPSFDLYVPPFSSSSRPSSAESENENENENEVKKIKTSKKEQEEEEEEEEEETKRQFPKLQICWNPETPDGTVAVVSIIARREMVIDKGHAFVQ